MSLRCPSCPSNVPLGNGLLWECDNWCILLAEHGKLAGGVRILAGAFLAPGLKMCPSGVPRVPQMSLSAMVCPGNVIIVLGGKQNWVS